MASSLLPMDYIFQYMGRAAPVLTAAQTPEAVSEDRWHQPWSEPVRFRILPALAIVLAAASGNVLDPFARPADPTPTIAYERHFETPVRVRPGLNAALQQTLGLTEASPFGETVTEARWHQPWSEPVRVAPRLTTGAQQTLAFEPDPVDQITVQSAPWFAWLSDPVRVPPRLGAALNPDYQAPVLTPAQQPEAVSYDRFGFAWSEPVRVKPGLGAAYQQTLQWLQPGGIPEAVLESKFHFAWSEPVRVKPQLASGAQHDEWLTEAAPFPEAVLESKFHFPWSEPVRVKPNLGAPRQTAFFIGVPNALLIEAVLESKWHMPWSEPVRLKPGLITDDQPYVAAQVIVPLLPNPRFTLRNGLSRVAVLQSN